MGTTTTDLSGTSTAGLVGAGCGLQATKEARKNVFGQASGLRRPKSQIPHFTPSRLRAPSEYTDSRRGDPNGGKCTPRGSSCKRGEEQGGVGVYVPRADPSPRPHRRTASCLPAVQPNSTTPRDSAASVVEEDEDATASSSNILSNKSDSVKVLVRIRPPNAKEQSHGYIRCIRQTSEETLLVSGGSEPQQYTFDFIAGDDVSQQTLFQIAGAPIVENVLEGFNACIFAYGQTGSGKTYTMLGSLPDGPHDMPISAGLTPRVIKYLFSSMERQKNGVYTVRCSLLEIYNETITDLLLPDSTNLQVREDNKRGTYVEGLTEEPIRSVEEAVDLMQRGAANRTIAETNMNCESSRSHCVMTIVIEGKVSDDVGTKNLFARLNLVDLAGSERQRATGALGERLKEASSINKSLSALGHVIMSLADTQHGKGSHIPYRDSKLTFLLQDSLGGNAKTVMIANASPAKFNLNETLSTLRFARGAKKIKNKAVANEDYGSDVEALRREIARLKEELAKFKNAALRSAPIAEAGGDESSGGRCLARSCSEKVFDRNRDEMSPLAKALAQPPKAMDKALVAALRREKEKDIIIEYLEADLDKTTDFVIAKENELQKSKLIIKFRDDKIVRLEESLKDSSSPICTSARDVEMRNLEHELALVKQQADTPSSDWGKYAVENVQLRNRIAELERCANPEAVKSLKQDVQDLEEKCLQLNEEVERYKQFEPEEVKYRAEEAASRAVSFASMRLEETMARAAIMKKEAEEQAEEVKKMREELKSEKNLQQGLQKQLSDVVQEAEVVKDTNEDLESIMSELEKQRDDALAQKRALTASIQEKKDALNTFKNTVTGLENSKVCLEERCEDLSSEIQCLEAEMEGLKKLNSTLHAEKSSFKQEIEKLNEELLTTAAELARKDEELKGVSDLASALEKREKQLGTEKRVLVKAASEAQSKADKLQDDINSNSGEVSDLFEENMFLKSQDKKMKDRISQLLQTVDECKIKAAEPDKIDMSIEVIVGAIDEVKELEQTCTALNRRIVELEFERDSLKTEASECKQLTLDLEVQHSKYEELEKVCVALREELDSENPVYNEMESKVEALSRELELVREQLRKVAKEKADLEVLCSNLMAELDQSTEQQATFLADTRALEEQVRSLEEEKQKLLEGTSDSESMKLNIQVAPGEGDVEWLQEEIEDLKDDIKRKDTSIKNMDVLLKGLLEENKLLKSKQAKDKETISAAVVKQRKLEDQVASEKKQRMISMQRESLRRSLMVRLKDSDEDFSSEINADPEYMSEVESSGSSPVNPCPTES
ncbi:hypothetical protein BSKO_02124 [Bryopsis sp. KO-2023]|nr:hypothetical protein BSKO_02124 [Bryopsis sp. KO-2023]